MDLLRPVLPAFLTTCALALALPAPAVRAEVLEGIVLSVQSGDSLTIRRNGARQQVFLVGIAAPDITQPYGMESRESLQALCLQTRAIVEPLAQDRYGRMLGRVYCDGINANVEQIRRGAAAMLQP